MLVLAFCTFAGENALFNVYFGAILLMGSLVTDFDIFLFAQGAIVPEIAKDLLVFAVQMGLLDVFAALGARLFALEALIEARLIKHLVTVTAGSATLRVDDIETNDADKKLSTGLIRFHDVSLTQTYCRFLTGIHLSFDGPLHCFDELGSF